MDRCFTARTNTHASHARRSCPAPGWEIEKITLPGQPISASGYNPAVVVNDFVFVAGNMALLEQRRACRPRCASGRPRAGAARPASAARCTTRIKERLEPSLKAAGSALEHCLKAQAYIRGTENFPDFMDVWSQHFSDIPCALTVVPAKDYASSEGMIEINLIALKNGATRRKQVVSTSMCRRWRHSAPASAPANWCFPPA